MRYVFVDVGPTPPSSVCSRASIWPVHIKNTSFDMLIVKCASNVRC